MSEKQSVLGQILRHPIALILLIAQSVFLLTFSYMSGVPKTDVTSSAKRVGVIVPRKSLLEFPFSSASEKRYYALSVDGQGRVVENRSISFADTSLDALRQRIRHVAVVPFSVPWQLAAFAFFCVFAASLCCILEVFGPAKKTSS